MTSRKKPKYDSPAKSLKAPAASPSRGSSTEGAALFGWLQRTVASTRDLTEPADPDWGRRVDDEYPPVKH